MMISLVLMCVASWIAIRFVTASKTSVFRGLLALLFLAFAFNASYDVRSARAAWNSCPAVTSGGDLTLDLTADTCSTSNSFPGTNDYINFNAGAGSSVTIDLIGIDDPSGSFSGVSIVHDGGTINISNGTAFGQANDYTTTVNCSSGCTVAGNYDAAPISGPFSVTYTQNAGSGAVGPPPVHLRICLFRPSGFHH